MSSNERVDAIPDHTLPLPEDFVRVVQDLAREIVAKIASVARRTIQEAPLWVPGRKSTIAVEFRDVLAELSREIDGIERSLPGLIKMLRGRMRELEALLRNERNSYIANGALAAMLETVRRISTVLEKLN